MLPHTQISIVSIAENIKPEQKVEKLPNGEILNNSLILLELVLLKVGGLRLVRRIGTKAIENSKDIMINGS